MDKIYKMTRQGLVYLGEEATFKKKDLRLKEELTTTTTIGDSTGQESAAEVLNKYPDEVQTKFQNSNCVTVTGGTGTGTTTVELPSTDNTSIINASRNLDKNNVGKVTLVKSPQNSSKQYSAKLVEMRKNSIPFTKKGLREYLKKL